jgi:glutathione S-transferase
LLKLYYSPGASSLASHIALNEAGLAYEAVKVNLDTRQTAEGVDYLIINAKGLVPALMLDDGGMLTESAAIVQFVADQNPGAELAPAHGTFARYRLAEWLNFIATEIHHGFGPLWDAANPDAVKDAARKSVYVKFAYVDKRLASTPYLMGDTFTVADAYLFTIVNWAHFLKIDLAPWPALQQFMARVAARPAVHRTLQEEGLLK